MSATKYFEIPVGDEQEPKPEPVAVRQWPKKEGGGLILMFPFKAVNIHWWYCQSWERVGEHGGAAIDLTTVTKPVPDEIARAAIEEYAKLYGQDPAGYRIVHKIDTRAAQRERQRQIAVWKA